MNDLITWLRAQIDEDERLARAASWELATGDRWSVWRGSQPYERPCIVVDHLGDGVADVAPENGDPDGVPEHIARHDPARVLAEVAAKRRIMAAHEKWCDGYCEAGFDAAHMWSIKVIATAYVDRPGYLEEWRP